MGIDRLAGLSLLGGVVVGILASFLIWIFGLSVPLIALGAVAGLVIGTPVSAIALYLSQK